MESSMTSRSTAPREATPGSPLLSQRIVYKSRIGTVRYVGPVVVASPTNTYVGIEWDEARPVQNDDELNDGSLVDPANGKRVRYFTTAPHFASFLKLDRERPFWTTTMSLGAAIMERYGDDFMNQSRSSNNAERVEVIEGVTVKAMASAKRLALQTTLSLRGLGITSPDANEEEESVMRRVCTPEAVLELDLGDNLLWDWEHHVAPLSRRFPKLKEIVLSGNRFAPESFVTEEGVASFEACETLVLDKCLMDVFRHSEISSKVGIFPSTFPRLTHLHVRSNGICEVPPLHAFFFREAPFIGLRSLNLSQNSLTSLVALLRALGHGTPTLERLDVSNNAGMRISSGNDGRIGVRMERLVALDLGGTSVDDESQIEALTNEERDDGAFPLGLQEIRFSPHLRTVSGARMMDEVESRALVLARCLNARIVNGSVVSPKERLEAERAFIKSRIGEQHLHALKLLKLERHVGMVLASGNLPKIGTAAPPSKTMDDITMEFRRPDDVSPLFSRKLPLNVRVSHLRSICVRHLKRIPRRLRLVTTEGTAILDDDRVALNEVIERLTMSASVTTTTTTRAMWIEVE